MALRNRELQVAGEQRIAQSRAKQILVGVTRTDLCP